MVSSCSLEVFEITKMPGNCDQLMPDANFLMQKMPDERFSRICKLVLTTVNLKSQANKRNAT